MGEKATLKTWSLWPVRVRTSAPVDIRNSRTRPLDWPVPIVDPSGAGPLMWIVPVPEPKTGKNRMHHDVLGDTQALIALGATLVRPRDADTEPDGAIEWDVLADPEGNEFCVFSPE